MQGVFPFAQGELVRRKRPERLFFALLLNSQTAHCVSASGAQFLRDHHLAWRLLDESRLHISLHLVGDFSRLREKFIYAARLAGEKVSLPPVEITLDTIKSFEGAPSASGKARKRPLVMLGKEHGLCDLHQVLGCALRKYGLRVGNHFTPHLTLAYGPSLIAEQAIDPIYMPIDEFVLIHSELGRTRYNLLGRWPLRG